MIISLRLTEIDAELVKRCAMSRGVSVSSYIREALLERIECEFQKICQEGGDEEIKTE